MGKYKNRKAAGKNEVIGEMLKGEGDMLVNWIWWLCNMAIESDVLPEDWRSTVIIPL